MPLEPLHAEVARRALELPEARGLVLAGGGAMLAHGLVTRPTEDIDLFTPEPGAVPAIARALADQLTDDGWTVELDERRPVSATFARLHVANPAGEALSVDLAQDYRLREPVVLHVGPVLHLEEVAADKVLALTTRGEPRDLLDVDALAGRLGRDRLPVLAVEKDAGFTLVEFARGMRVAAGAADERFAALGLDPAATTALKQRATRWADGLTRSTPTAATHRTAASVAMAAYPRSPGATSTAPADQSIPPRRHPGHTPGQGRPPSTSR